MGREVIGFQLTLSEIDVQEDQARATRVEALRERLQELTTSAAADKEKVEKAERRIAGIRRRVKPAQERLCEAHRQERSIGAQIFNLLKEQQAVDERRRRHALIKVALPMLNRSLNLLTDKAPNAETFEGVIIPNFVTVGRKIFNDARFVARIPDLLEPAERTLRTDDNKDRMCLSDGKNRLRIGVFDDGSFALLFGPKMGTDLGEELGGALDNLKLPRGYSAERYALVAKINPHNPDNLVTWGAIARSKTKVIFKPFVETADLSLNKQRINEMLLEASVTLPTSLQD